MNVTFEYNLKLIQFLLIMVIIIKLLEKVIFVYNLVVKVITMNQI